jgi:glycosyltransferase involved in cell wall biosynthesis
VQYSHHHDRNEEEAAATRRNGPLTTNRPPSEIQDRPTKSEKVEANIDWSGSMLAKAHQGSIMPIPERVHKPVAARVLFDTYPWAFVTPGGGEQQLLKYAEHLPGHGVEIVLHDHWNPVLDAVDAVHFFSCIGGSIHFCNYVRERGLPLVITSSLWIDDATKHLYPIDEIRSQLALADVIVANSRTECDALARILGLPRDHFMPVMNGVDRRFALPHDPSAFRRKFGIDGPFILNVGNVERRKNQLNLVLALAAQDLAAHDLPLVIIGNVREPDYAERVSTEAAGRMRFLGPLAHDDPLLASAYAACAVFALPSTCETPGLAALEAAAAGAPIVLTRNGSAHEYFGHMCHYVDPMDCADIARGIGNALAAGPHPKLSTHVMESFTWPMVTAALPGVYGQAVARCNQRRLTT